MEESISSSRTAGASFFHRDVNRCYASGGPRASAEASEDSGWTAYFYDDDGDSYQELQATEEEPAPAPALREKKLHRHSHNHGHGDRASASTVSTASKIKARKKKEVTKEWKKKRPRWEQADEDPLQDTASSLPANATPQLQLLDGWQIAGCYGQQRSSDTALQWIDYCSLQETHMGLPEQARCRKEGLVPLKLFVEQHYLQ